MAANVQKKVTSSNQYKDIISFIDKCSPRQALKHLKVKFPHIDELSLWSIDNVQYRERMKRNTWLLRTEHKFLKQIYQPYTKLSSDDVAGLLRIADRVDISPALVAKRLLEHIYSDLTSQTASESTTPTAQQSTSTATTQQATATQVPPSLTPTQRNVTNTDVGSHLACKDHPNYQTQLTLSSKHHPGCSEDLAGTESSLATSKNISPLRQLNECVISRELHIKWNLTSDLKSDGSCQHMAELSVKFDHEFSHFKALGRTQRAARNAAAMQAVNVIHGAGDNQPEVGVDSEMPLSTCDVLRTQTAPATQGENAEGNEGEAASNKLPTSSKKMVSRWLKEPHNIPDILLSKQVSTCIVNDTQYGPIAMALHANMGSEYEYKLIEEVRRHKLHYEDENVLRRRGYDKTPDIKLIVPIAVDGRVINWIESKASFGDQTSHKRYLNDQLWSYWNRFGPGLVIYWFGYVSEIVDSTSEGILISHQFPQTFVTIDTITHDSILP